MNSHPAMPIPPDEPTPEALRRASQEWAVSQGYTYEFAPARSEYGKIVVRDPADGSTYTTIPNAHHGRRLRQHQVRYTIQDLNRNWRG
jgi:hypothetical protein